jgi:hypothetical protein
MVLRLKAMPAYEEPVPGMHAGVGLGIRREESTFESDIGKNPKCAHYEFKRYIRDEQVGYPQAI